MAIRQLPPPKWFVFGASGALPAGWKISTFEVGTTTEKDTYQDKDGNTPHANPIVLDSRGEKEIWWDGNYKVVVKDANDVTIYTVDNYGEGLDPVPVAQLSLVKNYSFEDASADPDDPDDWTITDYTDGVHILDDTAGNQIHGAKAIKFTSVGTGGGFATSAFFPVQEAEALSISVAMKGTATVRNLIEILWYDRSQSLLSTTSLYDEDTTNPTTWTDQDLSATPPSNARFAKLRLTGAHSSDSTVGNTWFDNVRVVAISTFLLAGADMNGTELILDADGDTSITADTDDQIDFKAGGGDVAKLIASGATATIGGVVDRDVTQAEVVNTITETTVYSFSVPANTLSTNRMLRLTLLGQYLNFSGSNAVLNTRVKYGSTTLFHSDITIASAPSGRAVHLTARLSAANATNAQVADGQIFVGAGTTVANKAAAIAFSENSMHATVAEDSTGALTLSVTIEHDTADANISFKADSVQLELL